MATTFSICSNCDQVNRVNLEQAHAKKPVCGACKQELPFHDGVTEVNGSGLQKLVQKASLPVVADFWAPWCAPCKVFTPVFQSASREMAGRVVFVKVNTEANPMAGDAFRVRGIPTLILFKNGIEQGRQTGAMPLDMFMRWLKRSA